MIICRIAGIVRESIVDGPRHKVYNLLPGLILMTVRDAIIPKLMILTEGRTAALTDCWKR